MHPLVEGTAEKRCLLIQPKLAVHQERSRLKNKIRATETNAQERIKLKTSFCPIAGKLVLKRGVSKEGALEWSDSREDRTKKSGDQGTEKIPS